MSLMKYGKYAVKKYPAVRKRARVYVPAVKQLASDVMYLKGLINSEPMRFNYSSQNNFDYNGTVLSLTNVVNADAYGNRTGNRILPKHLNLRMHINKDTAGRMHTTIRYVLFRWWGESPNVAGVAPTAAEVLQTTGTWASPIAPLSEDIIGSKGDRSRRIEVHRTGMITLDCVSKTCIDVEENVSLNGKGKQVKEHIEYYNATTAPPTSGGFFLLLISDYITAADVQASVYSSLSFYDN